MSHNDDRDRDEASRYDAVAEALAGVLNDGEEFLVRCQEGAVEVEPTRAGRFRMEHPRIFGRLLTVQEQIDTAGGNLLFPVILAGGVLAIGLHAGWWDNLLGGPQAADPLRVWWVYLVLAVVGFFGFGWLGDLRERLAYRRARPALRELMRHEDLDRDELVNQLQEEPQVAKALRYLKLDSPFDPSHPGAEPR